MDYIDVIIPFVFGVMAVSIPQKLMRQDHPKLESRMMTIRKLGYGLIALTIVYGIIRYTN